MDECGASASKKAYKQLLSNYSKNAQFHQPLRNRLIGTRREEVDDIFKPVDLSKAEAQVKHLFINLKNFENIYANSKEREDNNWNALFQQFNEQQVHVASVFDNFDSAWIRQRGMRHEEQFTEVEKKFKQIAEQSLSFEEEFDLQLKLQDGQNEEKIEKIENLDFENIWSAKENNLTDFGEEFNQVWEDDQTKWQKDYSDIINEINSNSATSTDRFKEYHFEENNPFLRNTNAMEEGLTLNNESLSASALAYEAAIQQILQQQQFDTDAADSGLLLSDAWCKLGLVQAENEKEEAAIIAFNNAINLDPYNTTALLALSVSYTNEGMDSVVFKTMEKWFKAKYPDLHSSVSINGGLMDNLSSVELYQQLINLFLRVVQLQSENKMALDADIQEALGLLFYNSGQYDKSIDCFKTALEIKPGDYLLWNRLGATLANSGRSEEAIDAYFHALGIKAGFVRCRYNLGVSCMNIGCYKEAAEHFLSALETHRVNVRGTNGNLGVTVTEELQMQKLPLNIWDTLKRCFILMDRRDLVERAVPTSNLSSFKSEFDF